MSPHSHHHHAGSSTGRSLGLSVALTLAFVIAESAVGYYSRSLALMSDAGHNFADALALLLSWYAVWIATRPADCNRTFGYHRVGILAALVNAVSLVVIAVLICWEAIERLRSPVTVHSTPMIGMAFVAVVINTAITLRLHGEASHDLNVRGAYMHMLGDALSAVGVILAGIVIALTGSNRADPIVSLLIGGLILWSSWGILCEAVNILMEASPAHLDMVELESAIDEVAGVESVHDLHVWTVASGLVACSCHILVAEQSIRSGQQVLRSLTDLLEHRFGITHTTVQVEVEGCEPDDMYCTMRQRDPHAGHDHAAHDHDEGDHDGGKNDGTGPDGRNSTGCELQPFKP